MKNLSALLSVVLFVVYTNAFGQYTLIPDANFELALSIYDDIPNDGQIPTANIDWIGFLNVSASNIADLTGIEDFVALKTLRCYDNDLSALDISNLIELEELLTYRNYNLQNLDLASNSKLRYLICGGNGLTSLDLSNNPDLEYVSCSSNWDLANLDLTPLTKLEEFICIQCDLPAINVTQAPNLKTLYVSGNRIATIDLSNNVLLENLSTGGNPIASIDVSNNTELVGAYFDRNDLTTLDLSANTKLKYIYAGENFLTNIILPTNAPLLDLVLEFNQLEGCWTEQFSEYCGQLNYSSFFGNPFDGITNFISDQGFTDYCNNGTGSCCPSTRTLSGIIPSSTYHAGNEIKVIGTIPANAIINLNAPTVIFDQNSEVILGAVVTTILSGC